MTKRFMLLSFMILSLLFSAEARKKPRLAKIAHKVPQDTIVIPESVFDDSVPSDTIIPIFMELSDMEPETVIIVEELEELDGSLSILGEPMADVRTMYEFVIGRNPEFPMEIAEAYYEVGKRYGIRGDVALCQAIVETGWFQFTGGTAVTLDQNNFCGLGVTKKGLKGHSFSSVEEGVTAQIQHLYAYATKDHIPEGETVIDPRFTLVPRGVAPTWNDLNMRWAANSRYGESIIKLYKEMIGYSN